MKKLTIIFQLVIEFLISSSADTWKNPEIMKFFSENGKYMLKVFPTTYPDKYWEWQSANLKKKQKFSASDTTIILCYAILYKIENTDTIEVWNKRLINMVSPVTVIVANDGKSIVTFDNWYSMGYFIDVMVVYDEKGGLIKRYKLEEISPFPINEYERSISSIYWRCGAKYLDNERIEICFEDENKNKKTRIYNVKSLEFEY